MHAEAAITVQRPRPEVERLWREAEHHHAGEGRVTFVDAPGDRGTEIHVDLGEEAPLPQRLMAGARLAKVKDELRRFKQRVETGEVARSDAVPEGELAERKFKQRPAQPLPEREPARAGGR